MYQLNLSQKWARNLRKISISSEALFLWWKYITPQKNINHALAFFFLFSPRFFLPNWSENHFGSLASGKYFIFRIIEHEIEDIEIFKMFHFGEYRISRFRRFVWRMNIWRKRRPRTKSLTDFLPLIEQGMDLFRGFHNKRRPKTFLEFILEITIAGPERRKKAPWVVSLVSRGWKVDEKWTSRGKMHTARIVSFRTWLHFDESIPILYFSLFNALIRRTVIFKLIGQRIGNIEARERETRTFRTNCG